jgi:hypothetical protein
MHEPARGSVKAFNSDFLIGLSILLLMLGSLVLKAHLGP